MPAKSQAQQKFMGMVHAAQKGEKPASPAVAKVAKSMKKKSAKDFASTPRKGLPKHVKKEAAGDNPEKYLGKKFKNMQGVWKVVKIDKSGNGAFPLVAKNLRTGHSSRFNHWVFEPYDDYGPVEDVKKETVKDTARCPHQFRSLRCTLKAGHDGVHIGTNGYKWYHGTADAKVKKEAAPSREKGLDRIIAAADAKAQRAAERAWDVYDRATADTDSRRDLDAAAAKYERTIAAIRADYDHAVASARAKTESLTPSAKKVMKRCPKCLGKRKDPNGNWCDQCGGSGKVNEDVKKEAAGLAWPKIKKFIWKFWHEADPREMKHYVETASTETLKLLSKYEPGHVTTKGSPQDLQRRLISKELARRGVKQEAVGSSNTPTGVSSKEAVAYFVKLPMKELRKRQDLCRLQQQRAYQQKNEKAMKQLQQMENDLAAAVDKKAFGGMKEAAGSSMTMAQAWKQFKAEILPLIKKEMEQNGVPDKPARREAWNNYIDRLEKDGEISSADASSWTHPRGLETEATTGRYSVVPLKDGLWGIVHSRNPEKIISTEKNKKAAQETAASMASPGEVPSSWKIKEDVPSKKSPAIDALAKKISGHDRPSSIRANKCAFCGGPADKFRDALSRKEYGISGMCQKCQDGSFGENSTEGREMKESQLTKLREYIRRQVTEVLQERKLREADDHTSSDFMAWPPEPGKVWKTKSGKWGVRNSAGKTQYFPSPEKAKTWATDKVTEAGNLANFKGKQAPPFGKKKGAKLAETNDASIVCPTCKGAKGKNQVLCKKCFDKTMPKESVVTEKKAKLGSGARFKALTKKLAAREGIELTEAELAEAPVRNPKALAAWIGRKKYGKEKFQKMAAAGRKK